MGIDLNCGSEHFGCSYSAWKYLRYNLIAEKVLEFVNNFKEIEKTFEKIKSLFTYDLHSLFKEYNDLMSKNDNIELIMETSKNITIILLYHEEFLKSLDMDGVIYLINKSDCQGEYTVEESQRILLTIQNIRKHIITDEHEHKDVYDRLIKLFEESVKTNSSVSIS